MRKSLVVANWKMNGSKSMIKDLLGQLLPKLAELNDATECVICPPYVYLNFVAESLSSGTQIKIGAQNLASATTPAYTGEISPVMLREFGCDYVIIGHSERRTLLNESDELIAHKFAVAVQGGLRPILCVGETRVQQEVGQGQEIVTRQLQAVLNFAGTAAFKDAVIAYEPVWAIGTGLTATPEQAQAMHAHIRSLVPAATRILYGGSVNSSNAASLFSMPDIDGGLIGGASLKAQDFFDICYAASEKK